MTKHKYVLSNKKEEEELTLFIVLYDTENLIVNLIKNFNQVINISLT